MMTRVSTELSYLIRSTSKDDKTCRAYLRICLSYKLNSLEIQFYMPIFLLEIYI